MLVRDSSGKSDNKKTATIIRKKLIWNSIEFVNKIFLH